MLFLIWFSLHPVHVSVTSLDYVPGNNYFNGFVRIYMDDYIDDCKLHGYETSREKIISKASEAIQTLEKYLNEKLILKINNKVVKCSLDEVKINENEIDINLTFKNSVVPDSINVVNTIMTSLYYDQANMMIIKVDDFEEGVKFTPDNFEKTFIVN
ncbi:MAG TPA: DUF6702 family protein [Bacteroidales bacterium]|nr:DUF6702 family protein [Bacteroidales bacterium]